MTVREDYDLPERTPSPIRVYFVMAAVLIVAFAVWLIVPGAITVAILAVVLLGVVGFGVFKAMSMRRLQEPPGRTPQVPPSAR